MKKNRHFLITAVIVNVVVLSVVLALFLPEQVDSTSSFRGVLRVCFGGSITDKLDSVWRLFVTEKVDSSSSSRGVLEVISVDP